MCLFQYNRKPSGVNSAWITQNFSAILPENAPQAMVERHARVWLWHFLGGFLFPDSSGNNITWAFIPILRLPWEEIGSFSWGSAVLAWMYRQLCDGCRRTSDNPNLGGCLYLLQVWCWERWPVGRPARLPNADFPVSHFIFFNSSRMFYHPITSNRRILYCMQAWNHEDCLPTVMWAWHNAQPVTGRPTRRYREYTDTLDVLTQFQVTTYIHMQFWFLGF